MSLNISNPMGVSTDLLALVNKEFSGKFIEAARPKSELWNGATGTWALLDARTGRLLPAQVPTTMEGMVHELQIIRTSNRWSELEKADAEKARISKQQQMDQALQLPAPMRALGHWLEGLGLNTSAPLPAGSMTK